MNEEEYHYLNCKVDLMSLIQLVEYYILAQLSSHRRIINIYVLYNFFLQIDHLWHTIFLALLFFIKFC